jgi:hypothetical protein
LPSHNAPQLAAHAFDPDDSTFLEAPFSALERATADKDRDRVAVKYGGDARRHERDHK